MNENIEKEMRALEKSLEYHSRKYYIEDSPEISDFEYDEMVPASLRVRTVMADDNIKIAGRHIVEDVKGVRTKDYIIKRKLMLHKYGIHIHEM